MTKRAPTPWNLHVKATFHKNKHKPGYTFRKALSDAARTWNKGKKSSR